MFTIGLMSGTSMDGVDCALIETEGELSLTLHAQETLRYPAYFYHLLKLGEQCTHQAGGDLTVAAARFEDFLIKWPNKRQLADWRRQLETQFSAPIALSFAGIIAASTRFHLQAVQTLLARIDLAPNEISAVGYHGQTWYHQAAEGISQQVGDPVLLAEALQIPVIYDFRARDIALGGQGAPIIPIFHRLLLLRQHWAPAAVLNLGGIANISYIANAALDSLRGFDVGPANTLLDSYLKKITQGKILYDEDGRYSAGGQVLPTLYDALMTQGFLARYRKKAPPKSLDVNDFGLPDWLDEKGYAQADVCATLIQVTVDLIAEALYRLHPQPKFLVVSGGGAHNPTLWRALEKALPTIQCHSAAVFKLPNDILEAACMGYLAARNLTGQASTFPKTTGVREPCVLGLRQQVPSTRL